MDEEAIDRMVEKSMEGLDAQLTEDGFQKRLTASYTNWVKQRDTLRSVFLEFCNSPARILFQEWWANLSEDIRNALVLTSVEDLQETPAYNKVADGVCPELKDTDSMIKGDRLMILFNHLKNSRENDQDVFKEQQEMFIEYSKVLTNPQDAIKPLLTIRSCLLLNFMTNILVVFESEIDQLNDLNSDSIRANE
ncbi:hypothetical protein DFA_09330 [Cavenderia fasciculata]|uniref:Uncharacterized protein n=1 Tax=Cavenderia fasciculata TaxID=261658 RepID=F4Q7B8_CACFS|nr:uncharacterized protein DFA_09330 [Cavenderia fasciculata]EGG16300.1 hypothetical protein DFA_09330 [Cavenderia fasciculata]|eukprot:XP_004354684.1 hypothetical protein DFA_09330 [Cavenderia fasciculata]